MQCHNNSIPPAGSDHMMQIIPLGLRVNKNAGRWNPSFGDTFLWKTCDRIFGIDVNSLGWQFDLVGQILETKSNVNIGYVHL